MPMPNKGLNKVVEECGELVQVAAKRMAYPRGKHPDEHREKPLNLRIEDEAGDVLAAVDFMVARLGLDRLRVAFRRQKKLRLFRKWDKERRRRPPRGRSDPGSRKS